jgi:DNA topoisomerase-1
VGKLAKKNLVIVESPAKAKTIEKILGKNYEVTASFGHVRDLPKSKIGVDIENRFEPSYLTIKGKGEITKTLRALAKKSNKVFLASDPDREGEAIAWHIAHILKLDENEANRIEFNEITKTAIIDAVKHPRKIDIDRVNAQQARRILDRLVGYKISPLLWKIISSNTSAGRVQSVALKLICDLEDSIKKFIPEKYWEVSGDFTGGVNLDLSRIDNKKVDKIKDEEVIKELKGKIPGKTFKVVSAKISARTKKPPLPLKTSTLQQLASSYIGFSASKTMRVAQSLYEGLNIDGNHKGLITYMRTDSTRISDEAKESAKAFIEKKYGKEYVGNYVEKKAKGKIQDAHEAVRPTDILLEPLKIEKHLNTDQFKLYRLIWERFIISQLAPVKFKQFEILSDYDKYQFRGVANKIIFDGYYKVFKGEDEIKTVNFPSINEGDNLVLEKLGLKEGITKAPARLTESSLVKKLEAEGIGRPSTYASIIETLKKREYVNTEGKSFVPTSLGYEVKESLQENFPHILNVKFTAEMEEKLDSIEEGELDWKDTLSEFYGDLAKYLAVFEKKVEEMENRIILSDVPCPCGKGNMLMKSGRFGRYLKCEDEECKEKFSLKGIDIPKEQIEKGEIIVNEVVQEREKLRRGKPTDVYTDTGANLFLKTGRFGSYLESENFATDEIRTPLPSEVRKMLAENRVIEKDGIVQLKYILDKIEEEEAKLIKDAGPCEKCGSPFEVKRGRWGKFLACTGYPECKNIRKLTNPKDKNKDKKEKE